MIGFGPELKLTQMAYRFSKSGYPKDDPRETKMYSVYWFDKSGYLKVDPRAINEKTVFRLRGSSVPV